MTFSLSLAQTKTDTLNYLKLINRISDLEYLATIPKEKELSGSFSSYDRMSIYMIITIKNILIGMLILMEEAI